MPLWLLGPLRPVQSALAAALGLLALTACSGSGQTADQSAPATAYGRLRTASTQPTPPSDRSSEQLPYHLGVALENGLNVEELSEAITHLAFYAGWPNAMTAINHLKKLTEERDA
ncbi:carboxymuconolactone decarboxylase family protein [Streptomyces sp. NPDC056638]|uniref:carboxymuconolactone decarboxylase family protein n=1 Tax=Streptomyces sp. NPDC056638 TaxID=3345887 RepID=UPI0036CCA795